MYVHVSGSLDISSLSGCGPIEGCASLDEGAGLDSGHHLPVDQVSSGRINLYKSRTQP